MELYICEKPKQAAAYASALGIQGGKKNGYIEGNGITITWCIGHLLTPLDPSDYDEKYKKWSLESLPILPKDKWAYKASKGKEQQIDIIKKLLQKSDSVVIASDPDREGELIVVSLLEKYNYKKPRKRVWVSSLNKPSLQKAIKQMKDAKETFTEYLAAETRQKTDWIYGMNMTRGMSVANRGKIEGVLSVGRVQTPVLNMIVTRDLEIKNFKPISYYDMKASFSTSSGILQTDWVLPKSLEDETHKKCIDKDKIKEVLDKVKGKSGIVTKSEKKRKSDSPPLLYSLSELQKECDSKFGIGANETLSIAQSLYETHEATSYPRTDCQYVNNEQFSEVPQVFRAVSNSCEDTEIIDFINRADTTIKTRVWNSVKVEESAHHAIIPTFSKFDISKLNKNEEKVYKLIVKRYIANFFPNAESDSSTLEITCEGEKFKTSGSMPISSGWKEVIGTKSESKEIPKLEENDSVDNCTPKVESKSTKPPANFTEGTLIDAMKNAGKYILEDQTMSKEEMKKVQSILKGTEGLGTEATRAGILDTLFKRSYIEKKGKKVLSTEKGQQLIFHVPSQVKNISLTAFWESRLEKIRKGTDTQEAFLRDQEEILNEMLKEIRSGKCTIEKAVGALYNCPNCSSGLRQITSSKTKKKYWVCMSGDECKSIFNDSRGKPAFPKKVDQGDIKHTCEVCKKGILVRKISQKEKLYWQCPEETCKTFYMDDNKTPKIFVKEEVEQPKEKIKCLSCKNGDLERKKGAYGFYFNCGSCKTNFKDDGNCAPLKPVEKPTSEHKCPNCKDGRMVLRNGPKGKFFGCNQFPKCKTLLNEKNGKPDYK